MNEGDGLEDEDLQARIGRLEVEHAGMSEALRAQHDQCVEMKREVELLRILEVGVREGSMHSIAVRHALSKLDRLRAAK